MPGRQEVFEKAMQDGDQAAFDEKWDKAVEHYMLSVREFPTSTHACNSLGFALFKLGRLEDAYKVYQQAHRLDPADPLPIEKSADVLERMGRLNEAGKDYLTAAENYLGQHDLEKAISNWERATKLTPGLIRIHQKLAMAYERTGQRVKAINEYLKLAFQFQNSGKSDVAMQALERALRLDSRDSRVLNAITAVRSSKPISADLLVEPASDEDTQIADDQELPELARNNAQGPIGDAVEYSLEAMANDVIADMMRPGAGDAIQAIEMHRADINQEAVGAYQRAEAAGMSSPSMFFNLGALMVVGKRWDEAIGYLERVKSDDYLLNAGANHALSLAHIGKKRWKDAAKSLINTLRLVDLSLAMNEEETDELNSLYQRLTGMVESTDEPTLENFSQRLAEMLTGMDWKHRVAQTRSRIEDIISKDAGNVIVDIAQGEEVIEAMGLIDKYIEQRRFKIAMDEAHRILEKDPDFLVAHLRVAKIMMAMSQIEMAIQKYNLIARTYLMRGNELRATEILNEVIKVAPADISLRANLIELLEHQERWDDVLAQYIDLAGAYQNLADYGSARNTLDQALKLAQRTNAPQDKLLAIMHKMAGLDMQRMELRGALRSYQKIVEVSPEDTKARRQLADLYYRLNNPVQGIQEIDQLMQLYAKQKRRDLILEVLEQETSHYPNDMGLRSRLGSVYEQMSQKDKAFEQFEELRRLQTEAGLHDEARQTIRRIISLQPPQVSHYQQLLQQLGG